MLDREAKSNKEETLTETEDAKMDDIDLRRGQSLRTTRKSRTGSDTQELNTGNKRKLSQTDQVNSFKNSKPEKSQATDNSLNDNSQETAATTSSDDVVNTGRVARVTRSKSKLTSGHYNTGGHSPASSTSSNR